jgi:rubrerythrin
MSKEEIAKVLKMALALEKKNYNDYLKASKEAELQSIQKMFAFLAEEEERHIVMIRQKMKDFGVSEED